MKMSDLGSHSSSRVLTRNNVALSRQLKIGRRLIGSTRSPSPLKPRKSLVYNKQNSILNLNTNIEISNSNHFGLLNSSQNGLIKRWSSSSSFSSSFASRFTFTSKSKFTLSSLLYALLLMVPCVMILSFGSYAEASFSFVPSTIKNGFNSMFSPSTQSSFGGGSFQQHYRPPPPIPPIPRIPEIPPIPDVPSPMAAMPSGMTGQHYSMMGPPHSRFHQSRLSGQSNYPNRMNSMMRSAPWAPLQPSGIGFGANMKRLGHQVMEKWRSRKEPNQMMMMGSGYQRRPNYHYNNQNNNYPRMPYYPGTTQMFQHPSRERSSSHLEISSNSWSRDPSNNHQYEHKSYTTKTTTAGNRPPTSESRSEFSGGYKNIRQQLGPLVGDTYPRSPLARARQSIKRRVQNRGNRQQPNYGGASEPRGTQMATAWAGVNVGTPPSQYNNQQVHSGHQPIFSNRTNKEQSKLRRVASRQIDSLKRRAQSLGGRMGSMMNRSSYRNRGPRITNIMSSQMEPNYYQQQQKETTAPKLKQASPPKRVLSSSSQRNDSHDTVKRHPSSNGEQQVRRQPKQLSSYDDDRRTLLARTSSPLSRSSPRSRRARARYQDRVVRSRSRPSRRRKLTREHSTMFQRLPFMMHHQQPSSQARISPIDPHSNLFTTRHRGRSPSVSNRLYETRPSSSSLNNPRRPKALVRNHIDVMPSLKHKTMKQNQPLLQTIQYQNETPQQLPQHPPQQANQRIPYHQLPREQRQHLLKRHQTQPQPQQKPPSRGQKKRPPSIQKGKNSNKQNSLKPTQIKPSRSQSLSRQASQRKMKPPPSRPLPPARAPRYVNRLPPAMSGYTNHPKSNLAAKVSPRQPTATPKLEKNKKKNRNDLEVPQKITNTNSPIRRVISGDGHHEEYFEDHQVTPTGFKSIKSSTSFTSTSNVNPPKQPTYYSEDPIQQQYADVNGPETSIPGPQETELQEKKDDSHKGDDDNDKDDDEDDDDDEGEDEDDDDGDCDYDDAEDNDCGDDDEQNDEDVKISVEDDKNEITKQIDPQVAVQVAETSENVDPSPKPTPSPSSSPWRLPAAAKKIQNLAQPYIQPLRDVVSTALKPKQDETPVRRPPPPLLMPTISEGEKLIRPPANKQELAKVNEELAEHEEWDHSDADDDDDSDDDDEYEDDEDEDDDEEDEDEEDEEDEEKKKKGKEGGGDEKDHEVNTLPTSPTLQPIATTEMSKDNEDDHKNEPANGTKDTGANKEEQQPHINKGSLIGTESQPTSLAGRSELNNKSQINHNDNDYDDDDDENDDDDVNDDEDDDDDDENEEDDENDVGSHEEKSVNQKLNQNENIKVDKEKKIEKNPKDDSDDSDDNEEDDDNDGGGHKIGFFKNLFQG